MKKVILSIFFLGALLLVSCKENKQESSDITNTEDVKEEYFTLSINAVVEKDDTFTLYYLEDGQKDISKENSVSIDVVGSTISQILVFRLEEDVLPTKLLLRYGNEERTQKIQFFDSELTYYGEEFFIESNLFYQFFIPNKFIEYNKEAQIAYSKEKDKQYDPTFYSRQVLEEKIDFFFN